MNDKRIKDFPKCRVGTMYIHWGIHNKVAFGVAFFEDKKMVDFMVNYDIAKKVLRTFIKNANLPFIKTLPEGIKKSKPDQDYWNTQLHIEQNGILRFDRTGAIVYCNPEMRVKVFEALTK